MEERDARTVPDAGLLGCDREVFAQVWGRVAPGDSSIVEPVAPAERAPEAATAQPPMEQAPVEMGEQDMTGRQLQELVLGLLTDASVYRDLARRTRRSVSDLQELHGQKLRQAKRASAAYFLLAGVRYWPREATPVNPPEGFFPALRERFLAEGRLARRLDGLAGESQEPELRELYTTLAQDTRDMARVIRLIVERET